MYGNPNTKNQTGLFKYNDGTKKILIEIEKK